MDLHNQLEDQLIRTLLPFRDVMIPARLVYAALASITQTFSSLANSVEPALQERNQGPRDVIDGFFDSRRLCATC